MITVTDWGLTPGSVIFQKGFHLKRKIQVSRISSLKGWTKQNKVNIKCSHTKNLNIIMIITMIRIKSICQKLAKVESYFKVLV